MTLLIWRQHRWQALWTILTVGAVCALILDLGLGAQHWITGYHAWLRDLSAAGCPPPTAHSGDFHVRSAQTCLELKDRYPGGLQAAFASHYNSALVLSQYGLPLVFAFIGAMVGAPLVAREAEQRTHLTAWTQSVSRRRWYTAKIAALAAFLAVAGMATGALNAWLQRQLTAGDVTSSRWDWFASINLVLAGETVLTFALAVAFGAILRRTLAAIGAAIATFIVLLLSARWIVVTTAPVTKAQGPHSAAPPGSWIISSQPGALSYHPPGQYWPLQLALLTILLALAAGALASGWRATQRLA
jgi:ABC-type transport system involved in multi-copper enzyme maturation permease subunit